MCLCCASDGAADRRGFWESPCTPTSSFPVSCCLVLRYHVLFLNCRGWAASQAVTAGSHLQCGRKGDVWRLFWWDAEIHCTLRAAKWMGCTSVLSTSEVYSVLRYSSPDSGRSSFVASSCSFKIVFCEGWMGLLSCMVPIWSPGCMTWLNGSPPWESFHRQQIFYDYFVSVLCDMYRKGWHRSASWEDLRLHLCMMN